MNFKILALTGSLLASSFCFAQSGKHVPSKNDIQFKDATLKCFDGKVEIGIYEKNETLQIETGSRWTLQQAAKQKITVKIRSEGKVSVFTQNTVAIQDGLGNVRYQTFVLNNSGEGSDQMNIVKAMSLDYDHENGFLSGNYAVIKPAKDGAPEEYKKVRLDSKTMNCYDYTYGQETR